MAVAAPVGGRLEPEAPRPVTNAGDRWRLVVLLAVAAAVHVLVVSRTAMTARDGVGFARTAWQLAEPTTYDARATVFDIFRKTEHPPGYPAALLLASTVTHGATDQDRMLFAGQLVSAVAGTLLMFPLYWLGRTLFGQAVGFAGAFLFACLPVAARYTSDAVTEGLYLLGLCTAVLLGTRAVRKPTVGGFLLCGLAGGAAYMVRPEGALSLAAIGLVVIGLVLIRREPLALSAGRLVALTVGFLIVTAWYMGVIGGVSNKPSVGGFQMPFIRGAIKPGAAVATGPVLFAAWEHRPEVMLAELAKEGAKAFHYVPAAFAVVGLLLAARRLRTDPWLLVPMTFVGLMLPVLVALGLKVGYVSERHTLGAVMVLCPFAAAGFQAIGERLGRPWMGWGLLAVVIATMVPSLAKPLHRDRLGHKLAGEYLAKHAHPDDVLIDPFDWAGYYSGRTLKTIPPDPAPKPGQSRWAVIEPKENAQSKLPRLEAARNVVNDKINPPVVAFQWPEGVPLDEAKVVLYRQVIK